MFRIDICHSMLFAALLVAGCSTEPDGSGSSTRVSPTAGASRARPAPTMPSCISDGSGERLSTRPAGSAPFCADLDAVSPLQPPRQVARLGLLYDALPLRGRSWQSFVAFSAAWGRPVGSSIPDGERIAGLDYPPTGCISIQALARETAPPWQRGGCDKPAAPAAARDTRADLALANLCTQFAGDAPELDAAVLLFDHIVDSPARDVDGASQFADAVVGCIERGLPVRLVAQPSARRFAYVVGAKRTERAVAEIAKRLQELLSAPTAHTDSPNAIFRSDRRACAKDQCLPAHDIALSATYPMPREVAVTWDRPQPLWGKPPADLPPPVRDARRRLPGPLRPDAFTTICGSEAAVTADSTRPMADSPGLGGLRINWARPLGEFRSLEQYPFLEDRLVVSLQQHPTGGAVAAAEQVTEEAAWTERMSVAQGLAGAVVNTSSAEPGASAFCSGSKVALTPILRITDGALELAYWRSKAGDAKSAGGLAAAFPPAIKKKQFDPASEMELGDRFGWIVQNEALRGVKALDVVVQSSPLELDCITRAVEETLSSVVSFKRDDFDAWLCTAERMAQCAPLQAVCNRSESQPRMGRFFRELFDAPPVNFGGANRRAPDNARAATLSVARVFSAVANHLRASIPAAAACDHARVSLGCAAQSVAVSDAPPRSASPRAAAAETGSGSGSGINAEEGSR